MANNFFLSSIYMASLFLNENSTPLATFLNDYINDLIYCWYRSNFDLKLLFF